MLYGFDDGGGWGLGASFLFSSVVERSWASVGDWFLGLAVSRLRSRKGGGEKEGGEKRRGGLAGQEQIVARQQLTTPRCNPNGSALHWSFYGHDLRR